MFYTLADKSTIALVEVGPHGEVSVRSSRDGTLSHTNHYTDEKLAAENKRPVKGSEVTLAHMGALLSAFAAPLTMDNFITVSRDKGTGPDDGIMRTGGHSGGSRTLASWILFFPKSGFPELHVSLIAPDETEKEFDVRLDQSFWKEGLE
jgi:isopenicillin-N N-acyltransferase like protein